jgi:putative glycerol-1-phosphate prenyltransferase
MLAVLIDPDKSDEEHLTVSCQRINETGVDLIFVGGSLLTDGDLEQTIRSIKSKTSIPVLLFPGSSSQITNEADGILFLSLLSSRNAEMLIGQQVVAAPYLRKTKLEIISTAYLIIESGSQTTASYMSNSNPIPRDKAEIAASTALAGEYLGMKLIYLDGGSGAQQPISGKMIEKVRDYTSQPVIVGGGLDSIEKINEAYETGADIVVLGNVLEKDPNFLSVVASSKNSYTKT